MYLGNYATHGFCGIETCTRMDSGFQKYRITNGTSIFLLEGDLWMIYMFLKGGTLVVIHGVTTIIKHCCNPSYTIYRGNITQFMTDRGSPCSIQVCYIHFPVPKNMWAHSSWNNLPNLQELLKEAESQLGDQWLAVVCLSFIGGLPKSCVTMHYHEVTMSYTLLRL